MTANEAPKNLYLSSTGKLKDGISTGRFRDTDIEYTRTDVFIEKAIEYIITHIPDMHTLGISAQMDEHIIKDFRKYMKGE